MSAVDSPAAAEEAKSIVLEAVRDSSARAMGAVVAVEGRGVAIDVNGSEPIEPNSVQKVYTAGAALIELGDQHHFHTEIRTRGRIEVGGVLPGDLAFVASGDPTLSQAGLERLCGAVYSTGVRRVAGSLVVDDSRYDRLRSVAGWRTYYMPVFAGPLSAFALDSNKWRDDPSYLENPVAANAGRLRAALKAAGIEVDGPTRLAHVPKAGTVIVAQESASIVDIVAHVLDLSDSFAAELLLKELGACSGAPTTSGGLEAIKKVSASLGVPDAGSASFDGSGLSPLNTDTLHRQVAWLESLDRSRLGAQIRRSLPVAGRSGTLAGRFRGTPGAGRVRAKTGTRECNGTVNLAGYATTDSNRRACFAFVLTGTESLLPAIEALDRAVPSLLRVL